MNFLKKNGPYLISGLVLIALLLLFLPYLRGGYENQYYASGFYTIFNIKKSGLKPIASNGTPSALLIIAFILSVLAMISLIFHKKDIIITLLAGIILLLSSLIFYFAHLIMKVNLGGAMFTATFVLYFIPSLLLVAGGSSLYLGILNLKEDRLSNSNQYSYIRKK
ncbi:MAG: hypothetical protein WCZ47_04880 [Bacilli bacterium]|jgi:hypothetical protein|nr:hypothetical protein [Bacilli bacterium]NLN80386.1 hypothetical protein [Erysipelotrichia bacterium]